MKRCLLTYVPRQGRFSHGLQLETIWFILEEVSGLDNDIICTPFYSVLFEFAKIWKASDEQQQTHKVWEGTRMTRNQPDTQNM